MKSHGHLTVREASFALRTPPEIVLLLLTQGRLRSVPDSEETLFTHDEIKRFLGLYESGYWPSEFE